MLIASVHLKTEKHFNYKSRSYLLIAGYIVMRNIILNKAIMGEPTHINLIKYNEIVDHVKLPGNRINRKYIDNIPD